MVGGSVKSSTSCPEVSPASPIWPASIVTPVSRSWWCGAAEAWVHPLLDFAWSSPSFLLSLAELWLRGWQLWLASWASLSPSIMARHQTSLHHRSILLSYRMHSATLADIKSLQSCLKMLQFLTGSSITIHSYFFDQVGSGWVLQSKDLHSSPKKVEYDLLLHCTRISEG